MAKGKKKRTDPHRIPCSKADVERAKNQATSEAVSYAWAILFTVMRDKFGWGPVRLQRLWDEVNSLSDSIARGYVNVNDLMHTLKKEAGIVLIDSGAGKIR